MEFTGERYVPAEKGRIRLEHYHRYAIVLDVIKGRDVLDLACGEGYGSFMMASVARSVTGVDIDDATIAHAGEKYTAKNLSFIRGSASALTFPDSSFGAVVSFETIEHLKEQNEMLSEIRRILRPGGFLVISSPNRPVYANESEADNIFHVKELDFDEFDELLKFNFPVVRHYGQRLLMGSVIQPLAHGCDELQAWHDDGESFGHGSGKLSEPVYFVSVCGESEDDLPAIDMSIVFPENLDLVKLYVDFAKWAQRLDFRVKELNRQISELNDDVLYRDNKIGELGKQINDRDKTIASLNRSVVERDEQIDLNESSQRRDELALRMETEIRNVQARYAAMEHSFSWRLTLPLRLARRWILSPLQQSRHLMRVVLRRLFVIYKALPFNYQTRVRHRNFVSKHCRWIIPVIGGNSGVIPVLSIPQIKPVVSSQKENPRERVKTIAFQFDKTPLVSIVICVYGKIEYTLDCLASISANSFFAPYEIIVVNDCSPDNSADILSSVKGIRLIGNEENVGFIRSCNKGAAIARGEYICFLNNDTQVAPGWLDELVKTFDNFPGTGLVGSKLVYPDGRLQEAGGIIWRDGTAWNFGRFQDPLLPVYSYAREVDYCSGASIMVPKELFVSLGGFDEHYLPAYCEDSDLALKIRDHGYRVIYQPMSTVVHCEGISSGTDITQGVKSCQVENSRKLYERWKSRLGKHQLPGDAADEAKDRCALRRVLVIDHCTPTPDHDAGGITVTNLLLLLREMRFQVTFIPENNFLYMPVYTSALQRNGIEALYAPYCGSVREHLKESGYRYDVVLMFRPGVLERHIGDVRKYCPKAKILYHTSDLHFLRMIREADLLRDKQKKIAAEEMKRRELDVIRKSDAAIVHSTVEKELLQPMLPGASLHVFPLIMDVVEPVCSFNDRRDLVFIGGYQHPPNIDAVQYFVTEIMPLLRRRLPGVKFYAVGSKPPEELRKLAVGDVIVTGFVEKLTPLLNQMRISVTPLRYGAGIKGKIGSAMAVGLPVVATTLAAEGMSLCDGETIMVADGAEAFAEATAMLYEDEALWNKISHKGLEFAKAVWSPEAAFETLSTILIALGMKIDCHRYPLSLYSEREGFLFGVKSFKKLEPVGVAEELETFEKIQQGNKLKEIERIEQMLLDESDKEAFAVRGYCIPCDKTVSFLVDMQAGGQQTVAGWKPNWRERLECPICRMNNRQRLMATLAWQILNDRPGQHVYLMEQVTPIFQWALVTFFKEHTIVGSEYLGYDRRSGESVDGIRHEDIEALSFSDEEMDLILSNDVFEHVPYPAMAFAECYRVLKPGGILLASIPFHSGNVESICRARLNNGELKHLLKPLYHGNPVSSGGSLIFTDFGWDLLDMLKAAGFAEASVRIYASAELGHLGGGQPVFYARKE